MILPSRSFFFSNEDSVKDLKKKKRSFFLDGLLPRIYTQLFILFFSDQRALGMSMRVERASLEQVG